MAAPFDPFRWYWSVTDTNPGTQVYSSAAERFVSTSDPTYTAWLAADGGNTPAVMATLAGLGRMLNDLARNYYEARVTVGVPISANVVLANPLSVRYTYTVTASGLKIILPSAMSPRAVPIGTRITFSCSFASTASIDICANDGTTVLATVLIGTSITLMFVDNMSVNGSWGFYLEGNVSAYGTIAGGDFAQWVSSTQIASLTPANAMNVLGALAKAGDTMTGNLTLAKAGPLLFLNATGSNDAAQCTFGNGGLLRWSMRMSGAAESSGNVGSDFDILRYDDAGTLIGSVLAINRQTGDVSFPNNSTFRARLSADQSGIPMNTFTKVAFNTTDINIGSNFSTTNNRWTPPAGRVMLGAVLYGNVGSSANLYSAIYKNGAALAMVFTNSGSNTISYAQCHCVDIANGTDYYECFTLTNNAGGVVVLSNTGQTYFHGARF